MEGAIVTYKIYVNSKAICVFATFCVITCILISINFLKEHQQPAHDVYIHPRITLARGSGYVTNACFSADGKEFLALFGGTTVKKWNSANWQDVGRLVLTSDCVGYSFSPDTQVLAVKSLKHKNLIGIWNISSGHRYCTIHLQQPTTDATSIFFIDNSILAIQNGTCSATFWNTRTGKEMVVNTSLTRSKLRTFTTQYVALHNFDDNTVIVADKLTGHIVRRFSHPSVVYSVAISPDETKVAAGGREGGAVVWDIRTGKTLYTVSVPRMLMDDTNQYEILSVSFSNSGEMLATGDQHGVIQLWDAHTGQKKSGLQSEGPITDIVFSSSDKTLALCHGLGGIQICDLALPQLH